MAKTKSNRPKTSAARAKAGAVVSKPLEGLTLAQKISWFSVLAAVFLVPIAISNATFLGFDLPFTFDQFDIVKVFVMRACLLVGLAAWAWHILVEGGKIRRTPVEWAILAFIAWVTISAAVSIHPATAIFGKYRRFEGLLSFITYAVGFWLVLQLADRPSRIRQLAHWLFWAGVIVAGYGMLQSLGVDPIKWATLPFEAKRSFSTYGNPDLLGGWLMFSIPISITLALTEQRVVWRIVYWLGVMMNMWVWISAFTRGAWVGGAVGFVFLAVFIWRQREWPPKLTQARWVDIAFVATIAVIMIALIVASLSSPNEVMNFGKRLASITKFGEGSSKTRFEIWSAAIAAIKDRPIFGFGADTFRLLFPKYKPAAYVKDAGFLSVADNVHNYPLQLASGIGVPGMLLLYFIFGWAAVRAWPVIWKREADNSEASRAYRLLLGGFWAACAGYIVLLFTGLSVTGTSLFLWFSMAAVLSPTAKSSDAPVFEWGKVAALVAVGLCGILFVFNFVYVYADNQYLKGRLLPAGEERNAYAERAVRLNPFNDMYRSDRGVAYSELFLQLLQQAYTTGGGTPDQATLQQAQTAFLKAEAAYKNAVEFTPWEYDNYVFFTNLYNIASSYFGGDYAQKALDIAKRGVAVEPYGPAMRLQYAVALERVGNAAEAVKQLQYALSLDARYPEAAQELINIYKQQGQLGKALAVAKTLQAAYPDQPTIATQQIQSLEASLNAK